MHKMSQADQKSQAARFREAASELGADESEDALDQAMGALDLSKRSEAQHASDCAVHNAPAFPPGECDCVL
jgi:hypothetical protein